MPLLDLPPEIFAPIVSGIANDVDIENAFEYRLVCSE
jgi:hypothetical protein